MLEPLAILIIILILALLWRGPKNLPRIGEALGRGVREARRQSSEPLSTDKPAADDVTRPKV